MKHRFSVKLWIDQSSYPIVHLNEHRTSSCPLQFRRKLRLSVDTRLFSHKLSRTLSFLFTAHFDLKSIVEGQWYLQNPLLIPRAWKLFFFTRGKHRHRLLKKRKKRLFFTATCPYHTLIHLPYTYTHVPSRRTKNTTLESLTTDHVALFFFFFKESFYKSLT